MLLEGQVAIYTLVAHHTIILNWCRLQTAHGRDGITVYQDIFTTVGEVIHSQIDLSVQQAEIEAEVALVFNFPTQVGVECTVFA